MGVNCALFLGLDGKFTKREVDFSLMLSAGHAGCIGGGKAAAHGSRELRPEVQRNIFLTGIQNSQLVALALGYHC